MKQSDRKQNVIDEDEDQNNNNHKVSYPESCSVLLRIGWRFVALRAARGLFRFPLGFIFSFWCSRRRRRRRRKSRGSRSSSSRRWRLWWWWCCCWSFTLLESQSQLNQLAAHQYFSLHAGFCLFACEAELWTNCQGRHRWGGDGLTCRPRCARQRPSH